MESKTKIGLDLDEVQKSLKLPEHEMRVLRGWAADPKAAPIAPPVAAKMMALFLRGYSCHEILEQEAFKNFTAGAIVHARVVGRWDEAVVEFRERLRRSVLDQSVHLGQETARTIFDLLACANRHLSKRARAYLSGETDELPIDITKIPQYKALVEMYLQAVEPKKVPAAEDQADGREGDGEKSESNAATTASLSDREYLRNQAERSRRTQQKPPVEA